ncbi:hypothetical protein IKS57_06065 [bacterium]|nr:hypothetical protein [bacterium]
MIASRYSDTEDSYIADLAVGLGTGQIQIGGFSRSERTSKYNRLIEIVIQERQNAVFLGKKGFYNLVQTKPNSEADNQNA